jgi:hypothetical protein
MEQIFGLGPVLVYCTLLIHVDELLLFDSLVEVLVELPDHELDV